ncbi:MAG: hypothetical protein JEZ00_01300 [Anaerolineaceae bacterium]|nr:hypothetical protein [Anaerolineaceae bacterium]
MNTGMLWFDNDPKSTLLTKIEHAVSYYQQKYGIVPNICYLHPSMINTDPVKSNTIDIRPNQMVLPNHLWIGTQESPAAA